MPICNSTGATTKMAYSAAGKSKTHNPSSPNSAIGGLLGRELGREEVGVAFGMSGRESLAVLALMPTRRNVCARSPSAEPA
jgi:hypothetical protein